jgi:hypothetical protein
VPNEPERDRRLARQPRYAYRRAESLDHAVDDLLGGEAGRRMRRFQRVAPALRDTLPPSLLAKVRPILLQSGALTLEVSDGVAMHELRNHHQHALLQALASAGTGVTRLVWRLAQTR